jgi:predicted DNA-binding transcriptional regulator AlpA
MRWRIWVESEPIETADWSRRVDVLLDALTDDEEAHGPVGWGVGRTLGSVFEVEAEDARLAFVAGHRAFVAALHEAAGDLDPGLRRIELTRGDFEPLDLVGATDIARTLGVSRQRVYQLAEQPGFPQPAARLARGALWSRVEIEAWRDARSARRTEVEARR